VLEVKEISLSSLKLWGDNPRKNDHAVEAVAESVRNYGFNVPIICDQNFMIVAGHTRWKAAQKLGLEKVPVIIIEMDDIKRRAFAIADNKTGEMADWDFPKLKEVLEKLKSEDVDIKSLGFSNEELRRLLVDGSEEEDRIPDIDTDSVITKYGDLYILGNHRLLCGDSRNLEEVSQLTEGAAIDHVFGGPPYFNQREYSHWNEYSSYIDDMRTIIVNCYTLLKEGSVCVGISLMDVVLIMIT
jgi:hypothetical protein